MLHVINGIDEIMLDDAVAVAKRHSHAGQGRNMGSREEVSRGNECDAEIARPPAETGKIVAREEKVRIFLQISFGIIAAAEAKVDRLVEMENVQCLRGGNDDKDGQ